jgi:carbon dioxide concentrating mechanism protein CcmN
MPTSYHYHISGDVSIHESATIAPGVILQADPESRIIIGAGVCIGSGSVLHAHKGTVEVAQGVTIGTKVLLIGSLKIGENACIGSASTLFNCSLVEGQVLPPSSLLGNCGRQVAEIDTAEAAPIPAPEQSPSPDASTDDSQPSAEWSVFEASGRVKGQVYGQVYVSRIIAKMMPHSKQFGAPPQDNQPQS